MRTEFINPFIESALNVLSTMTQTEAVPGKPEFRKDNLTRGSVTGIIGMAGEQIAGNMIVSFQEAAIVAIVNRMLMESYTEVNGDIVDAVGELTNMISGGTKKILSDLGFQFAMATPVMVEGEGIGLTQLQSKSVVSIPFSTDDGSFWIDANLDERKT